MGFLQELNPRQREAATAGDGPVLIVAGAGAGKTRTLACRVAHLVATGVDPARIMLLTFTRRAADEMLRRAASLLERARAGSPAPGAPTPRTGAVWGGTFHAVANRLLRTHARAIGLDPDFTVLDQGDAEDLLGLLREERGLTRSKERFPHKGTCLAIYSRCVNGGEPLDRVLASHFPWCATWEDALKGLFAAYVDAKANRNVLDYDDLLLHWLHLLDEPRAGDAVARRFDHVLVDEYQDTNRVQADILERLRRDNRNITVVGDDAQSIFGFRAADVRNILDFPLRFPGARVVVLEQNYRSRQPILDVTNAIIALASERHEKRLWSARGGETRPRLVTCGREEDQTTHVVEAILRHREEGIPLREQAVLFRSSHLSDHLEFELTRRKIPYRKFGGLRFLEAAHVKDLLAFLRLLENPRDQLAWHRVLNMLEGIGPSIAARCFEFVAGRGLDPLAVREFVAPARARDGLAALGALLSDLSPRGGRVPLPAQVDRIRRFYEPIFERRYDNPEPRRRDLEQLQHIAGTYRSRQRFLTDLTLDPPVGTGDPAGPPSLDDDYLILSTIHSAKGCEWDVVYLIHASDGILPSDLSTRSPAEIEEERRLLYVACTRPRDHLYVLHSLRHFVKRGRPSDAHLYAQLTRFLPTHVQELFERVARCDEGAPWDPEDAAGEPASSPPPAERLREKLRRRWE